MAEVDQHLLQESPEAEEAAVKPHLHTQQAAEVEVDQHLQQRSPEVEEEAVVEMYLQIQQSVEVSTERRLLRECRLKEAAEA